MPSFLYYLPKARSVSAAAIDAAGLRPFFAEIPAGTWGAVEQGPAGWGCIAAPTNDPLSVRVRYAPAEQAWIEAPGYWVGVERSGLPGPRDLERPEVVDGHEVKLADGRAWLVPVARSFTGAAGFPRRLALGPDGRWVAAMLPQYAQICARAERIWEAMRHELGLADESEPAPEEIGDDERINAAVDALAVNYRIGAREASHLGILTTDNVLAILQAFVDWPQLTGDADKALEAFRKLEEGEKKALMKMMGLREEAKKTKGGFGDLGASANRELMAMVKGALSVTAVFSLMKKGISEISRSLEENKAKAQEAYKSLTRYAALQSMSPKDREFVLQHAGRIQASTASDLAFTWKSGGMSQSDMKEAFRQTNLAATLGEDPQKFGMSLSGMKEGLFAKKSIRQISNFLGTMAEGSPLSADEFATQYLKKVGGVSGTTDTERSQGGALLSAIISSMGAAANPEVAGTAAKGFLVKRSTTARRLLKRHGLADKDVMSQIQGLSGLLAEGKLDMGKLTGAFGEEAGPGILSLLQSPEAISRMAGMAQAGTASLGDVQQSMFERKVNRMRVTDPEAARVAMVTTLENQREISDIRRGYQQSADDVVREKLTNAAKAQNVYGNEWIGSAQMGTREKLGAIVNDASVMSVLTANMNRLALALDKNTAAQGDSARLSHARQE